MTRQDLHPTNFGGSLVGDVTGTQISTTVARLQGYPVAATAPAAAQTLQWSGAAWTPGNAWQHNVVTALTDGATIAVNAAGGNVFDVTLGGNRTLSNPSGLVNGQSYFFRVKQDATGGRTLTWGSNYLFGSVQSAPATTANALTAWEFLSDGTYLYAMGSYNAAAAAPSAVYYQCQGQTNYVAFVRNTNSLAINTIADLVAACKSYGFKALGTSNSSAPAQSTYTNGTDYLKAVGCYNCFWADGGNAWYYSYADGNGNSISATQTTCTWVAGTDAAAGGGKIAGLIVNTSVSSLNCGTFRGALGSGNSFGTNDSNFAAHPLVYANYNSNPTDPCPRMNTTSWGVAWTGTPNYLLCASSTHP